MRSWIRRLEQVKVIRPPGDERKDRHRDQSADEDCLPGRNRLTQKFDAQRHAGEQRDGAEFESDAESGAVVGGRGGRQARRPEREDGLALMLA